MLDKFEKSRCHVRFSTKKSVGFPALSVIFDNVAWRDFLVPCGRGGGMPRIQVELSKC
jgi:hypothetical protein